MDSDGLPPYPVTVAGKVQSIVHEQFTSGFAIAPQHRGVDVDVQALRALFYLLSDKIVRLPDAANDIPAGDAWLDRNKGEGDIAEPLVHPGVQRAERVEHGVWRLPVSQVIISGIADKRTRVAGRYQAVEVINAGRQGGTAETEVDNRDLRRILAEVIPEAEGGAAVKDDRVGRAICHLPSLQRLYLLLVVLEQKILRPFNLSRRGHCTLLSGENP